MKRNDFITTLLAIVTAAILVSSCASPNRSDGLSEESSETEQELSAFGTAEDGLANGDLGNFDLPADSKPQKQAASDELVLEPAPLDKAERMADDKEILGSIDESILLAPNDKQVARAAKEMAKAEAEKAKAAQQADAGGDDLGGFEAAPAKPAYTGPARVPKIPGAAIQRQGVWLNRFIFARKGMTPDSLATLLYGNPSQSKSLIAWNGKSWKPGKLVYYASPAQPDDREMRSFYQERNVPPEEYQLQKGDTLGKVAAKKYGDRGTWKEIAVINGMSKVEGLEPGTRIALYPVDLTPFGVGGASANGYRRDAVPPQPSASPTGSDYLSAAPAPQQSDPPAAVQPEPQQSVPPVTRRTTPSFNLNIQKLVEQNLFAIVIGGGVFVLLLLLMALAKQKKKKGGLGSMDEMGDDFGSPKKSRRK